MIKQQIAKDKRMVMTKDNQERDPLNAALAEMFYAAGDFVAVGVA